MRSNADPKTIELSDVQIDSTTEAFATVQMPAEIGPNKLATLKCKVDTGAGSNVMPLCAFTKLFPRHINADGSHPSIQKKTSSRHILIDLKELAISQEHITSPDAVMQNPLYMHLESAQSQCGHWCEKN